MQAIRWHHILTQEKSRVYMAAINIAGINIELHGKIFLILRKTVKVRCDQIYERKKAIRNLRSIVSSGNNKYMIKTFMITSLQSGVSSFGEKLEREEDALIQR